MTKEEMINRYIKEAKEDGEEITREEAEEMAEMEIRAKGIRLTAQADKPRKERKPAERKIDADKAHLIKMLEVPLFDFPHIIHNEAEIVFTYNDAEYTVKLIKHRAKKG